MIDNFDEVLLRSSPFRFLPDEHRESLRALFQEQRFAFGDTIVRQGDEADAYYVLVSGRARVVRTTGNGEELALKALLPGDDFGESALTSGGTRTATVRCSTSVEVLRLGRDDFRKLVAHNPALEVALEMSSRFKLLHGFLYEFSNFGRLPAPALNRMIEKLTPALFSKGELILREGGPPGPMYVVESGHVRVYALANGKPRNLAFYREGDFFGELSILNGSPRAASAEAVSDCRLLALDPASVRELEHSFSQFRALMEERLAQYSAETTARVPLDFAEELLPAGTSAAARVVPEPGSDFASDEDELEGEPGSRKRSPGRKTWKANCVI